jgi:23S rRNA (cytosine1962-C5)-methyltransferase
MPDFPRVVIKRRRARPFFARHPWVFASSVESTAGNPEAGDEVDVFSHEGQWIARGLYNPESAIRVRLYRWTQGSLDEAHWSSAVDRAIWLRSGLLTFDAPPSACRLIFSESDTLSGLTVDRYDRWLVAQFTSLALFARKDLIVRRLAERSGAEGILVRVDRSITDDEGLHAADEVAHGTFPDGPIAIVEHGIEYRVDPRAGQKTGFYLDQRDNRRAVAAYCRGKRVLDLFCYTGAFALNAARHGGAGEVVAVDSSSRAIATAELNARANGIDGIRFEAADVFEFLIALRAEGARFDVVIADPPKFARRPKAIEDAIKGYLRLNRAIVDVLEPDGVLATCSCSGLVDRTLFADMLGQVAEHSGRPIQILEQRGQAPDHPVSASCLETEYLKCFICRVADAETPATPAGRNEQAPPTDRA